MKKHSLIVTIMAAGSIGAAIAADPVPAAPPATSPSATMDGGGTRCQQATASVEVHGFYGSKEVVTEKVGNVNFSDRRVFLQITEGGEANGKKGGSTKDVRLFERKEDGSYVVTQWANIKGHVFEEVDGAIMKNKGESCVGEVTKKMLQKRLGDGKTIASLAGSGTAKDAFAPSVGAASGTCIKSIVIILC